MKKVFSFCLTTLLCVTVLAGCGGNGPSAPSAGSSSPSSQLDASQQAAEGTSQPENSSGVAEPSATEGAPVVYMTTDISPEGLIAVYEALGAALPEGDIAVKISTGEKWQQLSAAGVDWRFGTVGERYDRGMQHSLWRKPGQYSLPHAISRRSWLYRHRRCGYYGCRRLDDASSHGRRPPDGKLCGFPL